MRIIAIVVGIDHWTDFTQRFIHQLHAYNPTLEILLIDNGSEPKYPEGEGYEIYRIDETVGYNHALNAGLMQAGKADWYICFNNDCECKGEFESKVQKLNKRVLYGSGENPDKETGTMLQWSAWLIISNTVYKKVGLFDPELIWAFEDFDYELRAVGNGFGLETCLLPVEHLDKHSRMTTPAYNWRWRASREHFMKKWGEHWKIPIWLKD